MILDRNILEFLNRDKVKNLNIINFIENNPIYFMERFKDSVIAKGKSDENWVYISSSSEDELKALLKKCEEDEFFFVPEDWMLPFVIKNREIEWKMSCMKLIFPENKEIAKYNYEVRQLKVEDAEYIYHNSKYQDYTDIEYIARQIRKGISLAIYEEDKLAAWVMTHDDGAMGFMHVIEKYRKKGYGYGLTMAMIDRLRNMGKVPFVHIEEDNYRSMGLALKAGFTKDRKVHWIKIIK